MDQTLSLAKQVLEEFMIAYLVERNIEKSLSYLTDDIVSIGTGQCEMAQNKEEFRFLLEEEIENMPESFILNYESMNANQIYLGCVSIFAVFTAKQKLSNNEILSMQVRQTATLVFLRHTFKICHLHASVASKFQEEDEYYPLQFGEKTITQLKEGLYKESFDLLNNSIAGGMMGSYIKPGFPLYFINSHMLHYLGYTYKEFLKNTEGLIINCIHTDDRDFVEETVQKSFETGNEYKVQYRMLKKDGSFIWVLDKGKKVLAEDNQPAIINVCTDITQSILLQQQLKEKADTLAAKNKELENLTNNIPSGVVKCFVENDWEFIYLSDGFIKLFGYSPFEIKQKFKNSFYNIIFSQDQRRIQTQIKEQMNRSNIIHLEYRLKTKNNSILWILSKGEIITENGKDYFYGVLLDITKSKEKDAKIQSLTENIPGGVCEIALDDSLTLGYGNDAFYALLGSTPELFQKTFQNHFIRIVHEADKKNLLHIIRRTFEQKEKSFESEIKIYKKDCPFIWLLVRGSFTFDTKKAILNCVMIDITNRKNIEQKLKISEERFRIALSKTSNIVFDYDIKNKIMYHSNHSVLFYGLPAKIENAPEFLVENGTIHKDFSDIFLKMYCQIHSGMAHAACTVKTRISSGEYIWNKISLSTIYDENQQPVRAIGIAEDITKQKETEFAYIKEGQYRAAMLSDAMYYYEINITKDKIEKNSGIWYSEYKNNITYHYSEMLNDVITQTIYEDDKEKYSDTFSRPCVIHAFLKGQTELRLEHRRINEKGLTVWMLATMHLIKDFSTGDIKGFVYIKDINKQKQDKLSLEFQSQRDSLTKLYNKGTTEKLIRKALRKSQPGQNHGFMMIDVDHFKYINDTCGHMFGDRVLENIANGIKNIFRRDDIIGRIGGDEFVVFFLNAKFQKDMDERAQKICNLFSQFYTSENTNIKISCSIGISKYTKDGKTFEELFQKADIALYEAKKRGRNQYIYYNEQMDQYHTPYS